MAPRPGSSAQDSSSAARRSINSWAIALPGNHDSRQADAKEQSPRQPPRAVHAPFTRWLAPGRKSADENWTMAFGPAETPGDFSSSAPATLRRFRGFHAYVG